MRIYTRPWWFRGTIGLIFSMTIGNLVYTARMINFFNHFSFLVKVFKFLGQDIRPSHQVWLEYINIINPDEQKVKKLFIQILSAFKGERLDGIPGTKCWGSTNAHDARYKDMQPRQAKNKKWFFINETNSVIKTFKTSPNLVDYYVRFDEAVRSRDPAPEKKG